MSKKKRLSYTAEYKGEAAKLLREGSKPVSAVAKDIGVSETALRRWMRQAEVDAGRGPVGALTSEERVELTRLRREHRQVTLERDFLIKAAAFFAKGSL